MPSKEQPLATFVNGTLADHKAAHSIAGYQQLVFTFPVILVLITYWFSSVLFIP